MAQVLEFFDPAEAVDRAIVWAHSESSSEDDEDGAEEAEGRGEEENRRDLATGETGGAVKKSVKRGGRKRERGCRA